MGGWIITGAEGVAGGDAGGEGMPNVVGGAPGSVWIVPGGACVAPGGSCEPPGGITWDPPTGK